MESLKKLAEFLYDNWSAIIIAIAVVITLINRVKAYASLSHDEKVAAAKKCVEAGIMEYVYEAEQWYNNNDVKQGLLKKANVISGIYKDYPILAALINQDEINKWLSDLIDEAVETLHNLPKKEVTENE